MTRVKGYQFTKIATTNPGPTDDLAHGNPLGNRWVNTLTNVIWICVDSTTNSAVWKIIDC